MSDFSRGSEWRRWDLHVHTKGTNKNDQFTSSDFNEFCSVMFRKAIENNIAAIGITDYFSIDNYKKVLDYVNNIADNGAFNDKEKKQIENILLLPNVELRMLPVTDQSRMVNIHCIFNPESNFINSLDNRFFNELKCSDGNRKYSMNKDGIISYGQSLLGSTKNNEEAYRKGIDNFHIEISQLQEALKDRAMADNTIVVVSNSSKDGASAFQKHYDQFEEKAPGSLDGVRKSIYVLSDMIFSSNQNDRKYFLGQKNDSVETVKLKCGSLKPCIHGSDAHTEEELFSPDDDRFCWIKADLSFEGLKQIIYEPEDRVYIGEKPPALKRIDNNKTKYVKSLSVRQKDGYDKKNGIWFDNINIEFSGELTAIIGNKGSGKSTLSDIIGLLANTRNAGEKQENLSFLNKNRFKKKGFAENFEASLVWVDKSGSEEFISLDQDIDTNAVEKVKYLPQNYFENLTNDLEGGNFEDTLKDVAFSHISEQNRLGCKSFEELVAYKSRQVDNALSILRKELDEISKDIIQIEAKQHPDYKKNLDAKLEQKKKELSEHKKNKPKEVPDPSKNQSKGAKQQASEQTKQLIELNDKHDEINKELSLAQESLNKLSKRQEEIKQLGSGLDNIKNEFNEFINSKQQILDELGLNAKKLISIKIDNKVLVAKSKEIKDKISQVEEKLLSVEDIKNIRDKDAREHAQKESLIYKLNGIKAKINNLKKTLTEPEVKYQKYLEELKVWSERKCEIEGAEDKIDSLQQLESEKKYIEERLQNDLENRRDDRDKKSIEIFNKKKEIIGIYTSLKEAIDSAISQDEEFLKKFDMKVDVNFRLNNNFQETILNYINKNKKGSFQGADGNFVNEILEGKNLLNEDDISSLQNTIINLLENDDRSGSSNQREISDQVKDKNGFYEYLFSLKYLEPRHELKFDDKNLEELSPGEKGALLLVFYLMIDRDDIPLVIDQPEDNLDNKSVFQVLTHFMRIAKRRRQIIMVTHNPNLAIGADAEQIIHVSLNKKNDDEKFKFIIDSGSIENPQINKTIVDILEGTMPAFDQRRLRYRG